MYEYLYDTKKAADFVNREGSDKNKDWVEHSIALKDIVTRGINTLTVEDLHHIIFDLESLCDNDIDINLSQVIDHECTSLIMKNPKHYEDDWIYDKLCLDSNVKESMNTILEACKNWTNNHKNENLQLNYKSVEQLYDVLTELDDILNINKAND